MYVDKPYSDDALSEILANGVAPDATAEWPWLPQSLPGKPSARRRGLCTIWGGIRLYTYDELEVSEVGIEGYITENSFFDLGERWGTGVAVGVWLSDLVSMHFGRLARRTLSRAGWELEDVEADDGTIFRISAVLPPAKPGALGEALGIALLKADIDHLALACSAPAYLDGLKDFPELPARPAPSARRTTQKGSDFGGPF